MTEATKSSVLLIDDRGELLDELQSALSKLLSKGEADIRQWVPRSADEKPEAVFGEKVDDTTVLVVTDLDLTGGGATGLFGHTIVSWCQQRSIPVADFSRGNADALPKEPNLFELRIPSTSDEAAKAIASAYRGFVAIRQTLSADPDGLISKGSLAAVLATLLGRPHLEASFALYMSRVGSSALLQRLRDFAGAEVPIADKVQLLNYVLGHVLLNAILKYPGPILSERALCAYAATVIEEIEAIAPMFAAAAYGGPFADSSKYFWREDVDEILYALGADLADQQFEAFGNFNRAAVEKALGRALGKHQCERCGGVNGGFLCPFTHRPVCQRADCSVASSSWIPQGAQLSRVERNFYDEWAPLLGM